MNNYFYCSTLFALFMLTTSSLSAQTNLANPSLTGIWRMYNLQTKDAISIKPLTGKVELDTTKIYPGIFFKIVEASNHFTNLFVSSNNALISGYGTYTVPSSTQYVEHIEKSFTNPRHSGTNNVLFYQFVGDDYLILSYAVENGSMWEVWKRTKEGSPFVTPATKKS